MAGKYDDIIHLPHHVSSRHPPMSRKDRAAQFAPFAALTGYDEVVREEARLTGEKVKLTEEQIAVLDRRLAYLGDRLDTEPDVTVTYFKPDTRKAGGSYVTVSGRLYDVDDMDGAMVLTDRTKIPVEDVLWMDSSVFTGDFFD